LKVKFAFFQEIQMRRLNFSKNRRAVVGRAAPSAAEGSATLLWGGFGCAKPLKGRPTRLINQNQTVNLGFSTALDFIQLFY
jgi:hypothetical protein